MLTGSLIYQGDMSLISEEKIAKMCQSEQKPKHTIVQKFTNLFKRKKNNS